MIESAILQTADFSAGGTTEGQKLLAATIVLGIIVAIALARYKLQFVGLTESQKRAKAFLAGQREDQTPRTVRIPISAFEEGRLEEFRGTIRATFDRDAPDPDDHTTVRRAFGDVRSEFVRSWHDRTEGLPRLALYFGELAVSVAVLGGLATISAETFQALFTADSTLTLSLIVETATETAGHVISGGIDSLGAFPYAEALWQFVFAGVVLAATWVYGQPFVVSAGLVVAAIAVWYLDKQVPDAPGVRLSGGRSTVALKTLAAVGAVWVSGVGLAQLGSVFGAIGVVMASIPVLVVAYVLSGRARLTVGAVGVGMLVLGIVAFATGASEPGAPAGLYVAAVVAVLIGRHYAGRFRASVQSVAHDVSGADRTAAAYLLLRRIGAAYAGLAVLLVPAYAVSILLDGKLPALIDAYLSGSPSRQVLVGGVAVFVVAVLATQARDAYPELRAALREAGVRQFIRGKVTAKGMPIAAVVVAYFIVVGFGLTALPAFIFALVVGLLFRAGIVLFRRAERRARLFQMPDHTPQSVVVSGYVLETADGSTRYLATVNGTDLAHEEIGMLTDAVLDATRELFDEGTMSASVEKQFASDMLRYGIVDVDETETKLRQDAVDILRGRVSKQGGQAEKERIRRELNDQVPEDIWRDAAAWMRRHAQLRETSEHYILV